MPSVNREPVLRWKGITAAKSRSFRITLFVVLAVTVVTLTFMQQGLLPFGTTGDLDTYLMTLLIPIALCALLLGPLPTVPLGAISGFSLFAHATLMPLDIYELNLMSPLTTIGALTILGLAQGVFTALALRSQPSGKSRRLRIMASCVAVSLLYSVLFRLFYLVDVMLFSGSPSDEVFKGFLQLFSILLTSGLALVQVLVDALLMVLACLICDEMYRRLDVPESRRALRIEFHLHLLLAVYLVFMVTSCISFLIITHTSLIQARRDMNDELLYLTRQLVVRTQEAEDADPQLPDEPTSDDMAEFARSQGISHLLDGYFKEDDGTYVIFYDNVVVLSDDAVWEPGQPAVSLVGEQSIVDELADSGEMRRSIDFTFADQDDSSAASDITGYTSQIAFRCAMRQGRYTVLAQRTGSKVFERRSATTFWTALTVFVLLLVVYIATARLLEQTVSRRMAKTNAVLARITAGELDQRVEVRKSSEFNALSDGINETVDALKNWIAEAERRMESELETAKIIQTSALPCTFPPFPEISAFDLYASMNAAREVGGDFYDFFLIDERTLGFLIADVSGKGIPGALFMMAAKTELENLMKGGMELSEAIELANVHLCQGNDVGMFVTVWAAMLNYETGELTYVNAGHNPPLLRHKGRWIWLQQKGGLFLGTFEAAKYRENSLILEKGDELFLYTDGVNEAFSADEVEFGNERLEEVLVAHANEGPREIISSMRSALAEWAQGAEQSDDITMLSLEFGVAPEVIGSITVDAKLENLPTVINLLHEELNARFCPLKVQHQIDVAVEELFVNVCNYAYADQDEPGKLRVRHLYRPDPPALTVELVDQGVPFDPVTREDPTKPSSIQEAKIGGLGIFMVKKYMDDLSYVRDGDDNVVVFRKTW